MRRLQTNPLLRFSWRPRNGELTPVAVVHGTDTREYSIHGENVITLLQYLQMPRTYDEVVDHVIQISDNDVKDAEEIIRNLENKTFILDVCDVNLKQPSLWDEKGWREALYFHFEGRDFDPVDDGSHDSGPEARRMIEEFVQEQGPPSLYPEFDGAPSVSLPDPEVVPDRDLAKVLLERRTSREFSREPISVETLSTFLANTMEPVRAVRDYVLDHGSERPELYLLSSHTIHELYPIVLQSPDIKHGVYQYDIENHALHLVRDGDFADELREIAIGQGVDGASVVFFVSACFDRYQWRYQHSRALRNLYIESAALAHRIILSATAHGWNNFLTPALRDSMADSLTGCDGYKEAIQYLVAVGK